MVLSVGLKNDKGSDLIDLDRDPWKSLHIVTTKRKKEDYADEKDWYGQIP